MIISNTTIKRERLMKLSEELSSHKILYIQAPAGYGKTIFAGHWLAQKKEPHALVTLDEYDNSVNDFCRKMKNALAALYPHHEEISSFTAHPAFDSAPAEFLMRAVSAMPADSMANIVIDDLHEMTDPDVLKFLPVFLMRLPSDTKILITSRTAPPESFSGLILKNELKLVKQEQMQFDRDEIYRLYRKNHIEITSKQAETVFDLTEGWPIAVNALLLSGSIPTQSIPSDQLESFLKTQVWETWDERSRDFMIGTSIEESLTKDLCQALTGEKNSGELLESLLSKSSFLWKRKDGSYRFHKLFREFLLHLFFSRPEEYRVKQFRASGEWHLAQNDFYRAIERFSRIEDYDNIARCFDLLESIDRGGFDTERVMRAVRSTLNEAITEKYPYLLFMMAFTARNEGRIADFVRYADQYYANYPRVVQRNPELAHNIFFLYIMDFRYTLKDISDMAGAVQPTASFQGVRGSATLYFPLYHRSYRDFSDLALHDIDSAAAALDCALGPLLGEEREMLVECIRAGLYYEKGDLLYAQTLALSAAAKIRKEFAPESKFCVMILSLLVGHALGQYDQAEIMREDIQKMIETDQAFYLLFNFHAVVYKNRLSSGDTAAAQNWIHTNATGLYDHLEFFRLYGHFTTARAFITLGNFDQAIILLSKIEELCDALKRPLDVIEAKILLAIAYWKKKRGYQKKALETLESAIRLAQLYGYEQLFINEGAELENMLSRLKSRTIRSDYQGELSGVFVKKLYLGAVGHAQYSKGLTGGRIEQGLHFTQQQKRVMKLLCEGLSHRKIGETLGIQFSTVRSHVELIYKKLDVPGAKEAILKICELNLLEEEATGNS